MLQHRLSHPAAPPRVVLLGGSGFIGAAVSSHLRAQGIPVLSPVSRDLDLTAQPAADRLAAILRPDDSLVFASAITREKGRDAGTLLRNVTMAERTAAAIDRAPCAHVVYLSSDAVYGDDAANPVSELTHCDPVDLYGTMHLVRERILRHVCEARGVPLAILRPSIVYGPGDTHGSYGPNRFVRTARSGAGIVLFGGGEERRDHVFIDDVARLIDGVLHRRSAGTLNLATGRSVSFAEVAELFAAISGVADVTTQPRAVPITHREYDVSALRAAFPDFSPVPLRDGLTRTWTAAAAVSSGVNRS